MTLVDDRQVGTDGTQEQALFREARQRRRRRRLLVSGIVVLAAVIGLIVIGTGAGRTVARPAHLKPLPSGQASASASSTAALGLKGPEALAVASDGGVLIDERGTNQIVEREPNGRFKLIAGNGRAGFRGDGGPAPSAELDLPAAMAVAQNGTVYVADEGNNRIRAISTDGVITSLARLPQPDALAVGPNGDVYVADQSGVDTIDDHGNVTSLITPNTSRSFPNGVNPVVSMAVDGTSVPYDPDALTVSSSGDIYLANFSPKVVIRFPVAGPPNFVGQTTLASGELYVTPAALAPSPDGSVVVGDYGAFAVDRIVGSDVQVISSFGKGTVSGLKGVFRPSGVAVAPSGKIFVATDGESGGTAVPALIAIDPDGQVHLIDRGLAAPMPNEAR
jgi:serine/threonine-protein kinase